MFVIAVSTAYGSVPEPVATERFRYYIDAALSIPNVDGFEIPYRENGALAPWNDTGYLHASDPSSRHLLATVPGLYTTMRERPTFGLASNDVAGREGAVALIREAYEFLVQVNEGPGGQFAGVMLYSTPRFEHSSSDAFRQSLEEIVSWDWGTVSLFVEHCDSPSEFHQPQPADNALFKGYSHKGFLSLEAELDAVAEIDGLGIGVSWGRSTIEMRSPKGPLEHISQVKEVGRLGGVMFSGASPEDTVLGPPWADQHLPIRDWSTSSPLAAAAESSLLTVEEMERCLSQALAAPELQYLGAKGKPPSNATIDERIEFLTAQAEIVTAVRDRCIGSLL